MRGSLGGTVTVPVAGPAPCSRHTPYHYPLHCQLPCAAIAIHYALLTAHYYCSLLLTGHLLTAKEHEECSMVMHNHNIQHTTPTNLFRASVR